MLLSSWTECECECECGNIYIYCWICDTTRGCASKSDQRKVLKPEEHVLVMCLSCACHVLVMCLSCACHGRRVCLRSPTNAFCPRNDPSFSCFSAPPTRVLKKLDRKHQKWVSIPMKIPCLWEWTSINTSYFDVNYRGTIGFDTLPQCSSSGVCDPGHAYRTCPPAWDWFAAQAARFGNHLKVDFSRGFHGISPKISRNESLVSYGFLWFPLGFLKPRPWILEFPRLAERIDQKKNQRIRFWATSWKIPSLGGGRRTNRNYRKWRTNRNYQPSHSRKLIIYCRNDQSIATTHSVSRHGSPSRCPRLQVPRLQTKCMYSPRSPARKMQSWRASCTWQKETSGPTSGLKMATVQNFDDWSNYIIRSSSYVPECSRYIRIA